MKKIKLYIEKPHLLLLGVLRHLAPIIPDKQFLKMAYRLENGRNLNLDNPERFTEKIQWLKLYYRRTEFTTLVDKAAAKKYIAEKLGKNYVIPTLATWKSIDDIDVSSLPNQFVLKTTHGGGSNGVIICKDKNSFNLKSAKQKLRKAMRADIYKHYKEWPYKNVDRAVIAEPFMSNGRDKELTDYKFYCFNGVPKLCQVIADRHSRETIDFFDSEWRHQSFWGLNKDCKQADKTFLKPKKYDDMLRIASILSKGFPFLRVDLYNINNHIYFGEMTFYPASGFGSFSPDEWDYKLGDMIKL